MILWSLNCIGRMSWATDILEISPGIRVNYDRAFSINGLDHGVASVRCDDADLLASG